jgi:hypothetical protein
MTLHGAVMAKAPSQSDILADHLVGGGKLSVMKITSWCSHGMCGKTDGCLFRARSGKCGSDETAIRLMICCSLIDEVRRAGKFFAGKNIFF